PLDPENAAYLVDFELYLLDQGRIDEGLTSLRRAATLVPDDADIVGPVTRALHDHCESAEAERLLRLALFRNRRDQRFRNLWNRHQFAVLRQEQRTRWT